VEIDFEWNRQRLLKEIAADARRTEAYTGRAAFGERVMAAMGRVPREAFVSDGQRRDAYLNRPLPIGHGQTISQPYIVALMSDLLDLRAEDPVLEIGTGCGYQTAVLAELAAAVYTVEVIPALQQAAEARLAELGYANIHFRCGDGWAGWPEEAPFDAIIVTAAPPELPPALPPQLALGGRLLVPIGRQDRSQFLTRFVKNPDGTVTEEAGLPVAFVPLVGGG
jgi:protein-L-isoaspartate(D-aspartate) O-methyltransferase